MPQNPGKAKLVPLDLASGVYPNATGFAIGPKLYRADNLVPDWRDGRRLSLPQALTENPILTIADASHLSNIGAMYGNTALPFTVGRATDGTFAAWNNGVRLLGAVTPATTMQSMTLPAALATWNGLDSARVFWGHRDVPHLYQTIDGVNFIDYAPANVPTNAACMAVHLLRLWMAETIGGASPRFSRIWYTNPLDPDTIFPESSVPLDDVCRAMFHTTPGDIGLGATSVLAFGCHHSISILDGDPTQGNADLRLLDNQRGIAGQSLSCTTDRGAVLIATDGEGYLIPPGAQALTPVGEPVRNRITGFDVLGQGTSAATAEVGHGVLMYESPYILYWNGGVEAFVLDLSSSSPSWWGPVTLPIPVREQAAALLYHADGSNVNAIAEFNRLDDANPPRVFALAPARGTPKLVSGFLFEPDHEVLAGPITLHIPKSEDGPQDIQIEVTGPGGEGTGCAVTKTVPLGPGMATLTYNFDHKPIRGSYLQVFITGNATRPLNPEVVLMRYLVCDRTNPQ